MGVPAALPSTLRREAICRSSICIRNLQSPGQFPAWLKALILARCERRVLKSKFVPTLEQKVKQDHKVLKKAGLGHSLHQLPGPGIPGSCFLQAMLYQEVKPHPKARVTASFEGDRTECSQYKPTEEPEGGNKRIQSLEKESFVPVAAAHGHRRELQKYPTANCQGTRGTGSDGSPSVNKLEELKAGEPGDQNFSSEVVQQGREFFNEGNFLCRIPAGAWLVEMLCERSWTSIFELSGFPYMDYPPWNKRK